MTDINRLKDFEWFDHCGVNLIESTFSDDTVCFAAWTSTKGDEADHDARKGLINRLMKDRHGSPRFYIPGPDRLMIQVPGTKPMDYVMSPASDLQYRHLVGYLKQQSGLAYVGYQEMLELGIVREVARMALPVNLMSTCVVTMNARALMNFLSLRGEVRGLASPLESAVRDQPSRRRIRTALPAPRTLDASGVRRQRKGRTMNGMRALEIAEHVLHELDAALNREVAVHATNGNNLVQVSVAAAQLNGAKKIRDAIAKEFMP